MPHVFISYVRENQRDVDRLSKALKRNGIRVWLDRDSIQPGERWKTAVRKAITDGAFFIACFSAEYASRSRSYMNEELQLALDEIRRRPSDRAFFIPIILSATAIPDIEISSRETISDLQWVDLTQGWDKGIKRILSVVAPLQDLPFKTLGEAFQSLQTLERQMKKDNPDIVSVALDRRLTGGKRTLEWCVRIYVKKKRQQHLMQASREIPKAIYGLPVDVVEG
ncbi:MAG: toll/interleukin-1 receptor domain-containing protein [Blastocatellia bacterium]